MASELSPKEWIERINQGQRFQEKFARSADWKRYKGYYRHNFSTGGKRLIPVNMFFSLLRSMVAQVYFRNPKVTITPRMPGYEREIHARILQTVDSWLLGELMVKKEIKAMVQDNFLCGIGNGIIGYDSAFGFDTKKEFSLTQFDKKGSRIEFNNSVSPGMPWFIRARPEDVIWPWGCTDAKTAEWFALRFFRPIADMKSDTKYKNTSNLVGTFAPQRSRPDGVSVSDLDDSPHEPDNKELFWGEFFEVHDARTGKVIVVTKQDGVTKPLREDEDLLQIDGLPIETLVFNPDADYIYGIPDGRIIEPQQLELNEIRTQAMKHRRIDIVKGLVKKGVIKEEEIQKLTNEEVMAIVQVETEGSMKDAFQPITANASGILQDMGFAAELIRQDVREMVGFSRNAQGAFEGKTHISAEETKRVFQSHNIRLDERRDAVAELLTNIVRKFNQIIFTHWSQDRIAQIVGPDGAKWWLKFNGPQIKGEYDVVVAPEEGQSLDTSSKFEMGIQAADIWAKLNAGAIAQGTPVPAEIQRLIFNQFQSSGLDIDRLLAQTKAFSRNAQQSVMQQTVGGGNTSAQAVSPAMLAQLQGGQ